MHQAYEVFSILKQGVCIEAITGCDNNVILGTRTGQLIMYSVDRNGAVDMLMFHKNFSKKPIMQLEVVAVEKLLFILTDNIINVCDISHKENNFNIIHSSALTKGCTLFTLDVKSTKTTTGETVNVIRVGCAIKRRLQFFYWKLNILASPDFSIELKDIPKAMCWLDDLICVGYKDEYVIYNIKYNKTEKHDLIVTSSSHSIEPCICLLKNGILGVTKDEYLVTIDSNTYSRHKDDKVCIQNTVDASNSKMMVKPIAWSSSLLAIVWDDPYIIGRVANGIQIRSLNANGIINDSLLQNLPELSKTKYLIRSGPGIIFAAAASELWCLRLTDIPRQRQQLLQQKNFQLAIELTNISSEADNMKIELIRQIRVGYAKELFALKQYQAAMSEFGKAEANPCDVIRLFPNLMPSTASNLDVKDSFDAITPNDSTIPLEGKDLEIAILALIEFLALARQKEIVKLLDTQNSSKSLLSIIDTTLLKCYLETNDSLIAPLLRLNQCDLEESEMTLKKHEKYSELIILYQMNGKHKKALELLKSQADKIGSSLYGYERTIRYLQQLNGNHLPLILKFSDWVLKADPIQGLRIFTEDLIEVEYLPRAKVLDFLIANHKTLIIPYLEHVINVWNDTNTLFHKILINQYREKIESLINDQKSVKDDKELQTLQTTISDYRRRLTDLLLKSSYYSAEVILKDFPENILLEERAILLSRLEKHQDVLIIYVKILGDIEMATNYCEEHYKEDTDIFVHLIQIILNPLTKSPYQGIELHKDFLQPNQTILLQLLKKYATKIDPCKIWKHMPEDIPLKHLHYYLDTVLRTAMSETHRLEIKRALLTAEMSRVENTIREQQQTYFEINESILCSECRKRFTNQGAFGRYPNGELAHLSCHDKKIMAANLFGE